ncbi:ion channel [Lentibacillus sp. L22]|uniref:potassium channel family protein n=1 Tax=Lentibacillus TaxID=175304 RepID=UPI0022B18067|nr:potassium channel family protein [Lentibacillus daqui]
MHIFLWIVLIVLICIIIGSSLISFIRDWPLHNRRFEMKDVRFSSEIFYTLLVIYVLVILGFALIYFILSFEHVTLAEGGELREVGVIGTLIHSIYFSGVTLLTIGYGDIAPVGIGRFIALVEALIGYVLPTAFVLKLVQYSYHSRDH